MKKSVYTLFLCFLCVFCLFLCGCSENKVEADVVNQPNAFRIVRQANANGQIALAYVFPINSNAFMQKGLSENDVRSFRYYLSAYVGALAKQNRDRAQDGVKVSEVTYFQDVDGLGFSITFDDLEAQKRFFGLEDDDADDKIEDDDVSTKTSGFFIKRSEITTIFPVSNSQSVENLKQVCKLAITSWATMDAFSDLSSLFKVLDESKYIYQFSSSQSALKSEIWFDEGGMRHNVFVKTAEDIAAGDNQITFFVTQPNVPVWYVSAVFVVLAGMMVTYFVLRKKQGKQ